MTANCTAFCWSPKKRRWPQAAEAERELMAGRRRGPLHGIPYALKDIIETAGIRTTGHSKLRQDHVPTADADIVGRLKAAGGVLLGKLATWEFALGGPSWDLPWPPALNPWDTGRLPGGSSSGAGAAVAAGFVPGAVGTDTGGSVRGPAAFCGLAGIKPSYGRVSRRGVFPEHLLDGPLRSAVPQRRGRRAVSQGHRRVRSRGPRQRGRAGAGLRGRAERRRQGSAPRADRGLAHRRRRASRPGAGDRRGGRGIARPRRRDPAGQAVEPARLHRLQDDDLQRRALRDPRARSEDAAAGFRPHPAQPGIAGRADPRRGLSARRCAGAPRWRRSRPGR